MAYCYFLKDFNEILLELDKTNIIKFWKNILQWKFMSWYWIFIERNFQWKGGTAVILLAAKFEFHNKI